MVEQRVFAIAVVIGPPALLRKSQTPVQLNCSSVAGTHLQHCKVFSSPAGDKNATLGTCESCAAKMSAALPLHVAAASQSPPLRAIQQLLEQGTPQSLPSVTGSNSHQLNLQKNVPI